MPPVRPPSAVLRLALLGAAFVVALGLVALDPKGLRLYFALGRDLGRLDTQNALLAGRVERLAREARAARGDARSLERAARESGYVQDGELLFELR